MAVAADLLLEHGKAGVIASGKGVTRAVEIKDELDEEAAAETGEGEPEADDEVVAKKKRFAESKRRSKQLQSELAALTERRKARTKVSTSSA